LAETAQKPVGFAPTETRLKEPSRRTLSAAFAFWADPQSAADAFVGFFGVGFNPAMETKRAQKLARLPDSI
jgi:hypothetical protein